jgi:uncharacterized membrane protein HdeD (DUF308 family)
VSGLGLGGATQVVAKYWWMLLLRGVLAVILGILVLAAPGAALGVILAFLAAYLLVDGVVAIMHGISEGRAGRRSGFWIAYGAIGIVAGIIVLVWPGSTTLVLLYILGFWAIIAGISAIAAAVGMRGHGSAWIWVLIFGVLAILFGIRLLVAPGSGLLAILWFVGVWALISGVVMIVSAFSLRSATRR